MSNGQCETMFPWTFSNTHKDRLTINEADIPIYPSPSCNQRQGFFVFVFYFYVKDIKSSTKHLLLFLEKCKEAADSGPFLTNGLLRV